MSDAAVSDRVPIVATTRAFVALLAASLGWRLALSGAVAIALAFAEGAGLVLLVPLLASIGLAANEGPTSGISHAVEAAFAWVGLRPTLGAVLLIFVAISASHAILYRVHLLLNPSLEQRFANTLRQRLYAAIVSARWSFLVQRRATDLVHAVTSDLDKVSSATYQLLTLLTGLAVTTVYVAIAVRLSPELTAVVSLAGAAMLWTLRRRTERSADTGEQYANASRSLFHMTSESLAAVKIAKSLGAEGRDVRSFGGLVEARAAAYLDLLRSFAQGKMRLDLSAAVVISALLLIAVEWLGLSGPGLLVLVFVFARIMPRAMALQESAQMFVTGLPSFRTVMRLIDRCDAEAEAPAGDTADRMELRNHVRFDRVSYGYAATTPSVVCDVSVDIRAGESTAIVGPSGAGKSTFADLLIGLLQPDAGTIAVDGCVLAGAGVAAWRRSVGYVPQDTFLLHDTIRANLLWARPGASDQELWDALDLAAASEFVRAHPGGLDAIVGDRGVRLSGGERQRLALARALLTRPQLLVLDEATSALDAVNERQILAAVHRLRGRLTTVVITHRLSSIRDADVIHVFDRGALVESGSWAELSDGGGAFAKLRAAQAGVDATDDRMAAPATSGRATATHGQ